MGHRIVAGEYRDDGGSLVIAAGGKYQASNGSAGGGKVDLEVGCGPSLVELYVTAIEV